MKKISHIKKVFYTLLIAFAIIMFWRGVWGLMDKLLFPNNHVLSYVISLILGIVILYYTKNLLKHLV